MRGTVDVGSVYRIHFILLRVGVKTFWKLLQGTALAVHVYTEGRHLGTLHRGSQPQTKDWASGSRPQAHTEPLQRQQQSSSRRRGRTAPKRETPALGAGPCGERAPPDVIVARRRLSFCHFAGEVVGANGSRAPITDSPSRGPAHLFLFGLGAAMVSRPGGRAAPEALQAGCGRGAAAVRAGEDGAGCFEGPA